MSLQIAELKDVHFEAENLEYRETNVFLSEIKCVFTITFLLGVTNSKSNVIYVSTQVFLLFSIHKICNKINTILKLKYYTQVNKSYTF